MHPSYARNQPTSRPELYELSLVKRQRWTERCSSKVQQPRRTTPTSCDRKVL
jgi:hypothetical protein